MTAAALLALVGVAMLAAGARRQAAALFDADLGRPARSGLKLAGWLLLCASFAMVLAGDDRARMTIAWIGVIAVEALVIAMALSWLARRKSRP